MSSVQPGHSNESHTTADGSPDMRFKENGGGSHGNQGVGFIEEGDGTSRLVTEGTGEDTGTYKPSAHGGEKKDGGQDKRVSSDHGFGGDHERAVEAGQKGGSASYENDGLTQ
ncbi:uncharacterized protein IL334_001335 [Kwoniella shivajii]|uniref:Uncharacterized protein n=1 Tax=Kwoniella shivajii TaxID=564305 RepID=A0ABZ1CRL6_9TREE|nr:hypothetical protein IL334_001335 [Kwoniella shivajii]